MNDQPKAVTQSAFSFLSGTLLSRLSGVARDMSMAFCFGTSASISAFLVALRFAILLRRLFGEGALLNGFIPHFESIRKESPKKGAEFFRDVFFSMMLLLILFIAGAEWLLSYWIESSLIIYLVMLILPGVFFVCLFGICSAFLHCEKYFFLTSVAPVSYNAIWLSAVWGLRNEAMDRSAIGLSIAITLAFFSQWCVTLPKTLSFLRQHLSWKECFQPRFFSFAFRQMLSSLTLGIVGVGAVQINTAMDVVFARASSLEGPAYLNYAIHLQQLPLALFGIALSSALLPTLSRAFQREDHELAKTILESAVTNALFLIIPCTMGIFALGRVSINLLFARGDFSPISSLHTTECLQGYGLGLIPMVLALLFAPAFYAKKDFWTPTFASILSIVVNFMLNFLLIKGFHLGPSSLAYSTSFAAFVNALILYIRLPFRATLFSSFKKPAFYSSLACGLSILCDHIFFQQNPFPLQFSEQLFQFFALFTIFGGFSILMLKREIFGFLGQKT